MKLIDDAHETRSAGVSSDLRHTGLAAWRERLTVPWWMLLAFAVGQGAQVIAAAPAVDDGRIVIDVQGVGAPAKVPLFFSASVDQAVQLGDAEITGEMRLKLRVVQGRPETLTLGLSGDGEVIDVTGAGLRDWAVRQGTGDSRGKRFLDLRPLLQEGTPDLKELEVVVHTRLPTPAVPGTTAVLIATPGEAVGFSLRLTLQPDPSVDVHVVTVAGLVPLRTSDRSIEPLLYQSNGDSRLEVRLTGRGAAPAEAELLGTRITGTVRESAGTVDFHLRGQLRAQRVGARLRLLAGGAALSERTTGDGWHVELVPDDAAGLAYELVAEREGVLAIDVAFAARVREKGDWRAVDFQMPAGAVVPLQLEGLGDEVEFDRAAAVVPAGTAGGWQGFLPADGTASLAWKHTRTATDGALSFTSFEQTDVRIGAGLLRQTSQVSFRILQGKLEQVRLRLDGPGEILGVDGANIVGWSVVPAGDPARVLEVRLSRPLEGEESLVVRSQAALGGFPVHAEALRLTPEGGVRHSGFVRIANSGAVRLEVTDITGMMQLAPGQFPGRPAESGARQVFVYRFPAAGHDFRILGRQIQPEISVSQITNYELTETDRVIQADLELDVREAPLRDWSLRIPEDFSVVAVAGNDVADYLAETTAAGGYRTLKIIFGRAIEGRQLLHVRLEKNQSAGAGEWHLAPLVFPEAKTVRGHIGVVSAPGYRIAPTTTDNLVEVPLTFFPKQLVGLQQAWRLRGPAWTAALQIEALGQSVQADVFHLYSLKEGAVHGSVLINYFVVGAPASEWRIEIPETVGNIDVTGQNVRRDWRREGNEVIVSLHQPVLGAATLLVTFEQPMSARGGVIRPGEVRVLGVQGERGFIQVVSPLQVKHEVRTAEGGLLRLEPLELPTEYRMLTSAPSLSVHQYTSRPFALEINVEWYQPGELVDQLVDFAKLASQVSTDGQVVTDARFFVKTRGRKALRMVLPQNVKLWEARVDNEIVNARADGEQTLVPLPARMNPNEPVEVALRFGQAAGRSGRSVRLDAPRLLVPVVINEWTLRGDRERRLVPRGGNAGLVAPVLTETGFEWVSQRGRAGTVTVLALLALGRLLLRARTGWKVPVGLAACAIGGFIAIVSTLEAMAQRRANHGVLTYAATAVPTGETVSIHVANVAPWESMVSWWGVACAVAGAALLLVARASGLRVFTSHRRLWPVPGGVLITLGILAQHGGAVLFFALLGAATLFLMLIPGFMRWRSARRTGADGGATEPRSGGAASVVTMLALAGLLTLAVGGPSNARAAESADGSPWFPDGGKAAQSIDQTWMVRDGRLAAELEFTARGVPGDSFLFLEPPAMLTDFKGDGLRVSKVERGGAIFYHVVPEREGTVTARARFEMPVPDLARGLPVPTGPAAFQRIAIALDQGGWEVVSEDAVRVSATPDLEAGHSGATLALAPDRRALIKLQPMRRDIGAETTQFFTEVANLYVPGPGVVNGVARVTVRPIQGRVSELELDVPGGFTVGNVGGGPVGKWRFDPSTRRLVVAIEPAQSSAFRFDIETQLGTGVLPVDLALEPLRVPDASGEVGLLALAFGGDAQPESVRAEGMSPVNVQDFDAELLPRTSEGQPLAVLQQAWRYGREPVRVELRAAPVAPEVRVASRQVYSLDDDRLLVAVDLNVSITRVGLFKLSFVLPDGLEVESLSGAALSQWTEAGEDGRRVVTIHLSGRTIGDQTFALTLAGAAPGPQDAWAVPRLLVREATRHTGELLLVPGKGIRLRAVDRTNATQLDPRSAGGVQSGTLAFRLLQEGWTLHIGIEALEPWVTVQSLQDVTLREGQTLTRIGLRYRVENSAVKQLRVRLPGLTEDQVRTLRGTGPAVSDFVKLPDEEDVWEVRFQRGIAGETDVQIEYQTQVSRAQGGENVATPEFIGARQVTQFVAVRSGGRLELDAGSLPRGWQRVDWGTVPANLQNPGDRSVPALCFRVAEPEGALALLVRRHDIADALKLRVTRGALTTVFSPEGTCLTALELKVDVLEKSTLRVRLPNRAQLFNTRVNGEGITVMREGSEYLFHVAPNTEAERSADVHLVYSAPDAGDGRVALAAPGLSVPLENVVWRVVLPPGYELDAYDGSLRLSQERSAGAFGIEQYRTLLVSKRSAEEEKAVSLLEEATTLLQRGDQQRAGEMLSRVSNFSALDDASNEDARVQLRALKTQQAVLGLNTRRQRIYLDNRSDALRNEQLEQAATINPYMQGRTDFDPKQVEQLLMGNTAEENAALRGIASRIVDQQLEAEPAPGAIDVTLPERGRVLTFTRSLQVDGAAPLELRLAVSRASTASPLFIAFVLMAVAALTAFASPRRRFDGA